MPDTVTYQGERQTETSQPSAYFGWIPFLITRRVCEVPVQSLAYRLVALVKSLLGKGGKTDFQVRQWGFRRTRKSVVPLNQQAVTRRVEMNAD